MKRVIIFLIVILMLLCGCEQEVPAETADTTPPPVTVGICLPGRANQWGEQAQLLKVALEAKGIRVLVEYGLDDVLLQQSQVQGLVHMPVDCLVVSAYDPLTLCGTLKDAPMPVLSYDRMLQLCDSVDGFIQPDYYAAGKQLATFALEQYDSMQRDTPLTAELMMGPPQDPSSYQLYLGIMEVLQPLLDSGKLECRSGRTQFEDVFLTKGDLEEGRDMAFDYLGAEYENSFPDVFFCGNDAIAEGCTQALEGMCFSPDESWPVVTGLGGTEDGLYLLEEGYLTATVTADNNTMTQQCVRWILDMLEGKIPSDRETLHNGVAEIPGYLQKMDLLITP